jgi:hypothetical protein
VTAAAIVPAIDSVWREDDARAVRHVRVVCIVGDRAQIEKVTWDETRREWAPEGTRVTYAALKRFGRSGGYKAVPA